MASSGCLHDMIVSEEVCRRHSSPGAFRSRFLGTVQVKGKSERVRIHEVFDADPDDLVHAKMCTRPRFEEAVALFEAGDVSTAVAGFEEVLREESRDRAAASWLRRARRSS